MQHNLVNNRGYSPNIIIGIFNTVTNEIALNDWALNNYNGRRNKITSNQDSEPTHLLGTF